jgi:heptosyltransferase III
MISSEPTQSGATPEVKTPGTGWKRKFGFLRAPYRFLFQKWCAVRANVAHIGNSLGRKKLLHKLSLWLSYLANVLSLRITLLWVRFRKPRRRVVVIVQAVHMGDIIACEPVIRHVKKNNPDTFIIFACEKAYRELADSHPEVDCTLSLKCISEWIKFADFAGFDEVIDLNIYGRTCPVCGLPWFNPAGSHGVTLENYFTFGSLLTAFTKSAGIEISPVRPRVFPRQQDVRFVDKFELPKLFVSIHAGSNEAIKDIPIKTWKHIVRHINKRWNLPVVEIGLKPLAIENANHLNRQLSGKLSILQSAEVIRRSILYIGGDSGPAHLANATGAYGIILFGHYRHFQKYMPYTGNYAKGRCCGLLYHDGPVAEMPLQNILKAIDQRMTALNQDPFKSQIK